VTGTSSICLARPYSCDRYVAVRDTLNKFVLRDLKFGSAVIHLIISAKTVEIPLEMWNIKVQVVSLCSYC